MTQAQMSERDVRIQKVQAMRHLGIVPFAQKFDKQVSIGELVDKHGKHLEGDSPFRDIETIIVKPEVNVKTAGRLMLFRSHGKLSFGKLLDETGEIQLMFHRDHCFINKVEGDKIVDTLPTLSNADGDDEVTAYKFMDKFVDVGDFLGVEGELFYTHKGELTIFVSAFTFLSKAIQPLGDKFHGIQGTEAEYRQRYLDMIFNRETLERMKLRSKFLKTIRDFYHKNGFMEIETPVLGNSASGAAAAPFVTHHNGLDMPMYLRISPETALKKSTVGMFEKVFEAAKDFRNEGSDPSHLQEFTMIEHYAAYWNYEDNMKFTEDMFDYIFDNMPELSRKINVTNKAGETKEVDFTTPWARVDYTEQIKKDSGIDVSDYGPEDEARLRDDILAKGHTWDGIHMQATATMIDYLYKKVTRPKIVGPAFIYNYPKTMQPLARVSDTNSNMVEQWQWLINGREVIKAYSELVDPLTQQANFDEQKDALERGDEEATSGDDEFVKAMEYGMPPQSGRGMGIARIFSLLMEHNNVRDVVLFPLVKPEDGQEVTAGRAKETKLAIALINKAANMEPWQEMNTVAHLNASFAAREGMNLLFHDKMKTSDDKDLALNIQHAIMIKEAHSNNALIELIKEAQDKNIHMVPFTKEMLETTNDKKIIDATSEKDLDELEYLGVLLFGKKDDMNEMTSDFPLYGQTGGQNSGQVPAPVASSSSADADYDNLPSRGDAKELAAKYLSDTKLHCEQVGHIMEYFAKKLGQDEDVWYLAGLLHDVDWDHIDKDGSKHLGDEFESIVSEISLPKALIDDIRSHYYEKTGVPVDLLIRKYLIAVDELSGLLYAYARMRPEGFEGMKRSSIKKKIKDKNFAAGVDREHVVNCEKYLDIPLQEFALEVVEAMKTFKAE